MIDPSDSSDPLQQYLREVEALHTFIKRPRPGADDTQPLHQAATLVGAIKYHVGNLERREPTLPVEDEIDALSAYSNRLIEVAYDVDAAFSREGRDAIDRFDLAMDKLCEELTND
jgi:hypothetical protein